MSKYSCYSRILCHRESKYFGYVLDQKGYTFFYIRFEAMHNDVNKSLLFQGVLWYDRLHIGLKISYYIKQYIVNSHYSI